MKVPTHVFVAEMKCNLLISGTFKVFMLWVKEKDYDRKMTLWAIRRCKEEGLI